MRLSKMYLNTLRDNPAEAEIPSHQLLLRAGFIRKLVSGVYGFMPMGLKVVNNIENIVREEMNNKDAQEILMSAIQPAELWQESGRWDAMGPEMFRLKDRNDRDFCLGPTHEEIFTDIVRNDIKSHKQLPLNLYQIQTKYRDEKRPRFGLMRSREFIMKDAYSFDKDYEGLDVSYNEMYDAYGKIFDRCGLKHRAVEADTGAMGGSDSHEFTALSEHGEGVIAYCDACEFAATDERAEVKDDVLYTDEAEKALEEVATPGQKTIEDVAKFLGLETNKTIKTLLYKADDQLVAAVIRGDRTLNETKLLNAIAIPEHMLEFASEQEVKQATGAETGYAGPVGLKDVKIIMDSELETMKNMTAGGNKTDIHISNVNYGRDFTAEVITDLKMVQENDECPRCQAPVKLARGIEVGQVFKLGTKYSESMGAMYRDENMNERVMVMGCYGIGVTRTMAAIIEQHHDENGIIWPMSVAPYQVYVAIVNVKKEEQVALGEKIYKEFKAMGIDAILDDRNERAGVKFKDADLIGIPVRVVVGKKADEGIVEYKERVKEDKEEYTVEEAIAKVKALVEAK